MSEDKHGEDHVEPVAPGYPAVETLKDIDVSGWEPAAVFRPQEASEARTSDQSK